jgi:hypothetical protein
MKVMILGGIGFLGNTGPLKVTGVVVRWRSWKWSEGAREGWVVTAMVVLEVTMVVVEVEFHVILHAVVREPGW